MQVKDGGRFFVHIYCHGELAYAYLFETEGEECRVGRAVRTERQALDLAIAVDRATHLTIEPGDPVWSGWIEQVRRLPFHHDSLLDQPPQQAMDARNIGGMAPSEGRHRKRFARDGVQLLC